MNQSITVTSSYYVTIHHNDSHIIIIPPANFIDIVGIWLTGALCLLGLIGNVLSFIVLVKAFGRSPMFFVLRSVAVSDTLFLLTVFIIQTVVNMYPSTGIMSWFFAYRGYIQLAVWPILMMTQMSTVWLTILVSVERYIAICYPLRASYLCSLTNMRRAVVVIFSVSVLYNIPRFFEHNVEVDNQQDMIRSELVTNDIYRYFYMSTCYTLFLFLIPLAMLIFLNTKLVRALQVGKKKWQEMQSRQKREQTLTVIPLTIVLVFFICGTPALVVNIIVTINPDYKSENFVCFLVIANFLVALNSACNFIIYCLLGQRFRHKLLYICGCSRFHRSSYEVVHQLVTTPSKLSRV